MKYDTLNLAISTFLFFQPLHFRLRSGEVCARGEAGKDSCDVLPILTITAALDYKCCNLNERFQKAR